jgi:hypothetical protein
VRLGYDFPIALRTGFSGDLTKETGETANVKPISPEQSTTVRTGLEKDLQLILDATGKIEWENRAQDGTTQHWMSQQFVRLTGCKFNVLIEGGTTSTVWPNESFHDEIAIDLGQASLRQVPVENCCSDSNRLLWEGADIKGTVSIRSPSGSETVEHQYKYLNANGGRETKQFQDDHLVLRYASQDAARLAFDTLTRAKQTCNTAR